LTVEIDEDDPGASSVVVRPWLLEAVEDSDPREE
jgi:hypothetical protein